MAKAVKINKKINPSKIPAHVAFIMDGNGRWAKKRGLPRKAGHKVGYEKMVMAVKRCADIGIKYVSIYAFSTENWKRPQEEIDEIFRLIRDNMHRDTDEFMEYGIRVTTMGDIKRFPQDLQDKLDEVMEKTKNNNRCVLCLCINYGGRADIVNAVNTILAERTLGSTAKEKGKDILQTTRDKGKEIITTAKTDKTLIQKAKDTAKIIGESVVTNTKTVIAKDEPITEDEFSKYLYGADMPNPDLIVRTSGEQRISNFMLWQMAYSEFLFIDPHWPDLNEKIIDKCIIEFQGRNRRFGKVQG